MAEFKISRQEIISLCRLCLAKDLASIDIFETGSETRQLFTKIVACLPVQIMTDDSLPKKICEVCNSKVDDFYQFWTSTAKNQKQLNDWLQIATTDSIKTDTTQIKVEADDTRQGEEYDDYDDGGRGDDEDDDDEDAPSAPKRIKTQDSGDEDFKPTNLVESAMEDTSDINGQQGGSNRKSKERQLFTELEEKEDSSFERKKSKDSFHCDTCGKYFRSRQICNKHIKRVHLNPNKTFKCDLCSDRFSTSAKLKKHVDKIHFTPEFQEPSKKNEPLDTGDYTLEQWNELVTAQSKDCPVCHKTYSTPKSMRKHLREVHSSQKKYVCDMCGKQFTSNNRVSQHKAYSHFGIIKTIERKFECDYCKMKFKSKSFLSEHINTHTGNKPYQCQICKKSFANKRSYQRDLKRHKQLAGQLKPEDIHECKICHKTFLEKGSLAKHMNWVHGDKCHICKVCGAKIKGNLQKHMLSHTGEKPFCCHICGKSLKGNLKDHILKCHTGERPYKCDVCGSSFKDKWYLGVHMRKHNGEKPYNCDYCGQTFAARSTFTFHLKKHEGKSSCVKTYSCQICKLRFENELDLSSHYSEHFGHI